MKQKISPALLVASAFWVYFGLAMTVCVYEALGILFDPPTRTAWLFGEPEPWKLFTMIAGTLGVAGLCTALLPKTQNPPNRQAMRAAALAGFVTSLFLAHSYLRAIHFDPGVWPVG
ncbi:MAG: hypothetical protein NT003_00645 [Candidatus Magasanikbacteria bacterium]|nr:hypothetical protein [Candidatus Magasanikbacteria bacterium]